jgi:hypothetical protein
MPGQRAVLRRRNSAPGIRAQAVEHPAKTCRGFAELAGGHADRSCTNAWIPNDFGMCEPAVRWCWRWPLRISWPPEASPRAFPTGRQQGSSTNGPRLPCRTVWVEAAQAREVPGVNHEPVREALEFY